MTVSLAHSPSNSFQFFDLEHPLSSAELQSSLPLVDFSLLQGASKKAQPAVSEDPSISEESGDMDGSSAQPEEDSLPSAGSLCFAAALVSEVGCFPSITSITSLLPWCCFLVRSCKGTPRTMGIVHASSASLFALVSSIFPPWSLPAGVITSGQTLKPVKAGPQPEAELLAYPPVSAMRTARHVPTSFGLHLPSSCGPLMHQDRQVLANPLGTSGMAGDGAPTWPPHSDGLVPLSVTSLQAAACTPQGPARTPL